MPRVEASFPCPLTVSGECLVERQVEERQKLIKEKVGKITDLKIKEIERVILGTSCEGCEVVRKLKKNINGAG